MENATADAVVHAPISPVLRRGSLRLWSSPAAPSGERLTTLLEAREALLTTSARAAIALALEQLGVGAGDEVLMPAYHCTAMRAPVESMGAKPVFYKLDERLEIDLNDLKTQVTARTRAVMTVHFFGFPQDLSVVRSLCDVAGLALIEDCAHAFYGPRSGAQIGRMGDFTVGSLMKFFPVFDGGCLVSFRRPLVKPRFTSRSLLSQAKAAVNMIEIAAEWSTSRALKGLAALIGRATQAAKGARPELARDLAESAPGAASGSLDFQPEWVHARMSLPSRLVLRFANHEGSIARRRAFYAQYAQGLAGIVGGQPLRTDLPEGVVPYVFPFVLSAPATGFPALRAAGVPVYRWEDVAEEACATARHYKPRLVQFPVHPSLKNEEVVQLIRTITQVLATSARAESSSILEDRA